MAVLTNPQRNFVQDSIATTKALMKLYGKLVELDVLWAGAPGYSSAIDQTGIDSQFPGMTQTNLADVEFALSGIKNTITNALAALSVLDSMPG